MNKVINLDEIKKLIPHRPPILMIDKVLGFEPGKSLNAIKNISIDEEFFKGHFPGRPIMPGVMIIEAMAQSACVLFRLTYPDLEIKAYYLGSLKVRFLNSALPGDVLKINVSSIKMTKVGGVFETTVCLKEKEILKGEMSFMVK